MCRHEVRHPDGTHLAVGVQLFQGVVGRHSEVELPRQGLVQDEQVDLVDTKLARALVEGVQRGVVAVVGDPGLRLDEDLVTAHAGPSDGLADLTLVSVDRGGVDVAVSGLQRGHHGIDRLLGWGLVDAEPDRRDVHAVVQGQGGNGRAAHLRGVPVLLRRIPAQIR